MAAISKFERTLCFGLIGLGVILRVWIHYPTDFWEDEIIAGTHAVQPFPSILWNIFRNDFHGPLFFLQLHVWGLVSHSDIWLTLNPVAWGLAAMASMWWTANRLYGERVALLAAAIFAVLPSAGYMADQLRMYSMLATLIIWLFYFTNRVFAQPHTSRTLLAQAVLLLAVVNMHAIAFLAVMMNGFYALHLLLAQRAERRAYITWLVLYGLAALAALPWLASDLLHDANFPSGTFLHGLISSMADTAAGNIGDVVPLFLIPGFIAFAAVCAIGLSSPRTRPMTWIFILAPILLSTALAVFLKPIYKWNFFSTMEAPFIALIPALVLAAPQVSRRMRTAVIPAFVALLCAVSIATRLMVHVSSGYRDNAGLIRANWQPGDIVFVPQLSMFWGTAWYLAGSDWRSPLAIEAPPSPQWQKLFRLLGPRLVKIMHLTPEGQLLRAGDIRILTGNDSAPQAQGARRIWLLTVPRADLKPGYPPPSLNGLTPQWSDRTHLWVTLYAAAPQTVAAPPVAD
ncbi:MAG TPA: hypothetical protein VHZ32_14110 [Rhizomicrobium sp.]|jgi:hypothetical protein|nr:hypothetical protein [Rhizomicrobium sp.]